MPVADEQLALTNHILPREDERNREYLIRRAALGDNPSQVEMRVVDESSCRIWIATAQTRLSSSLPINQASI